MLKVETIVTQNVVVDVTKIPSGVVITLESVHGLNKVVDSSTPIIMLYVGEWTLTAGDVTADQLRLIIPDYEIKESEGKLIVVVTSL